MALKDLISDLSNFKYGMSSPDKIDDQIDEGVDFFPNDDARGFTPKTNLESLYYKANSEYTATEFKPESDGVFSETWGPDFPNRFTTDFMTPIADTISRYSTATVPSLTWALDPDLTKRPNKKFSGPVGPHEQSQFTSPFMNTPIADAISMLNDNPFSLTLGTKAEPIRGDKTYNDRTYYITNQPAGNNYNWPHHEDAHSITDSLSKLLHDTHHLDRTPSISSPEHTFGEILGIHTQPQFISDFLTISLEDYVSQYPTTPSVTWGDQDGTMVGPVGPNVQPQFQNPFLSVLANHQSRFAVGSGGGLSVPDSHPVSVTWDLDDGWSGYGYIPSYVVRDGTLIGMAPTWPAIVPETNLFRIGAITNFPTLGSGGGVSFGAVDPMNESPFGGGIPVSALQAVTQNASGGGGISSFSNLFIIPAISSGAIVGKYGRDNSDYVTEKNLGPWNFSGEFGPQTLAERAGIGKGVGGFRDVISNDKKRYGGGKGFPEVLAGLDSNNKEIYASFREVADPEHFQLFRQPFILREIGNQWGIDNFEAGGIGGFFGSQINLADNILGGFVRGAPGFTGLVSRNITDKFRIGKFLLTGAGLTFLGKQFVLQALNPTLESKIYNPLSVFGIVGAGDMYDTIKGAVSGGGTSVAELASGLGSAIASAFLPIGHPERHLGGMRYEDVNPLLTLSDEVEPGKSVADIPIVGDDLLKGINKVAASMGGLSRLAMQSNPELIKETTVSLPFGMGDITLGGKDLKTSLMLMNPNRYLFPVSSAPKSIDRGVPSFLGGPDLAVGDALTATTKKGGTFNEKSAEGFSGPKKIQHATLGYHQIPTEVNGGLRYNELLLSPKEMMIAASDHVDKEFDEETTALKAHWSPEMLAERAKLIPEQSLMEKVDSTKLKAYQRWDPNTFDHWPNPWETELSSRDHAATINRGSDVKLMGKDTLNILPVLHGPSTLPEIITKNPDFIKFRFKDVVNNKYLVFRAILSGITDTITPEFNPIKYIGRPDNLYTYKGVDREIGFNFKVYPKTKQELPVLMEKLNYLVGLCYPSYTEGERMITPFIELTLGDMFVDAPGLLSGLTLTVEDAGTWEIEEGLQFPHYISAACTFKYIGKHIPVSTGKHYDLDWLSGDLRDGTKPLGTYNKAENAQPQRTTPKYDYISTAASLPVEEEYTFTAAELDA